MDINRENKSKPEEGKMPMAETGNASNPSPTDHNDPAFTRQVLGKHAEKYMRESGNIEDMPDPQDEYDADKSLEKE